jgi:hypothetical protein
VFERGELSLTEAGSWLRQSSSVSPSELQRWRAQQRAVLDSDSGSDSDGASTSQYSGVLSFRPDGAWQLEDLKLLDRALERAQRMAATPRVGGEGQNGLERLVMAVVHAIVGSPDAALRPRLEELLTLAARQGLRVFHVGCHFYNKFCEGLNQEPDNLSQFWEQEDDDD